MSSRAEEEEDPRRLMQIEKDEARGLQRRSTGLDLKPGRMLTKLEELAVAFVAQGLRSGKIKTDQMFTLFPAYGDALDYYHNHLEVTDGDGPNGSMVEVRDHMLPQDLLIEYVDGEPKPVALRLVTVTFSPKG